MNLQVIEKQDLDPEGRLAVHHIFTTIQGEGPYAGWPSVFIRLAGCNLRCPHCDTDYTSLGARKSISEKWDPAKVLSEVRARTQGTSISLVVISGGEPFRQNIVPAIDKLLDYGYLVQIETNGTLYVPLVSSGDSSFTRWDDERIVIVCSPKAGKIDSELAKYITAYKYVLHHDSVDLEDGLPILALGHTANPRVARPPSESVGSGPDYDPNSGMIYLQPADIPDEPGVNELNLQAAIKSCMRFGYILGVQIHKVIGLE